MVMEKIYPEGLLGKKLGMTQVFAEDGRAIPVTVIHVGPCYVLGVRSKEKNGYQGVQLGFDPKKSSRCNKAEMGHFSKAEKGAFYHVKEIRCDNSALGWTSLGQELKVAEVFKAGECVDVTGNSIGRGFAGVVKRFKVKGQPATRGTHEYFRHIGSIGCRKTPGRVFKNKSMPGHMGNEVVTVQNLEVVAVNAEENLLLVKGGTPGAKNAILVIRKAIKSYITPAQNAAGKVAA